jgi:hypothetical protein
MFHIPFVINFPFLSKFEISKFCTKTTINLLNNLIFHLILNFIFPPFNSNLIFPLFINCLIKILSSYPTYS